MWFIRKFSKWRCELIGKNTKYFRWLRRPRLGRRIFCIIAMQPVYFYQWLRILFYRSISTVFYINSSARFNQPVLITGEGSVTLGKCYLGVWPSPYFLNGYIHIEARSSSASIIIEDGVWINNNAVIIAEKSSIRIGANTLIGTDFTVYDSDFHNVNPAERMSGTHKCTEVNIGCNVFIGSRVTVLKGVCIGDNSVIASGSIVTRNIPSNSMAAGSSAKIVGSFVSNIMHQGKND